MCQILQKCTTVMTNMHKYAILAQTQNIFYVQAPLIKSLRWLMICNVNKIHNSSPIYHYKLYKMYVASVWFWLLYANSRAGYLLHGSLQQSNLKRNQAHRI